MIKYLPKIEGVLPNEEITPIEYLSSNAILDKFVDLYERELGEPLPEIKLYAALFRQAALEEPSWFNSKSFTWYVRKLGLQDKSNEIKKFFLNTFKKVNRHE